jgi:hypothetical protein
MDCYLLFDGEVPNSTVATSSAAQRQALLARAGVDSVLEQKKLIARKYPKKPQNP